MKTTKKTRTKKLHAEDREILYSFIDYVRLAKSKPENVELEITARHIAKYLKINSEQSNARLANAIAAKFEAGLIK